MNTSQTEYQIQTIDHSRLFSARRETAMAELAKMHDALSNQGVFFLVNHGLDTDQLEQGIDNLNAFLAHEKEEKERHSVFSNPLYRGYEPPYGEDKKESFIVGIEEAEEKSGFRGANLWPDFMGAAWRHDVYQVFESLLGFSKTFHKALALSLGLKEDALDEFLIYPNAAMRMLRYPAQKEESGYGIAPHTDWGCLSLIYQRAGEDGLEILTSAGDYVLAKPPAGALIVNVGEMVSRLSNDIYQAVQHRVINKTAQPRHSIAFFLDCDPDSILRPLTVKQGEQARYEPVKVSDFLEAMHKKDYAPHTPS